MPMLEMEMHGADEEELLEQIQRDRVMAIDSAIVRTMHYRMNRPEVRRSQLLVDVCEVRTRAHTP